MSVSRPKKGKIIPRKVQDHASPAPSASTPIPVQNPALLRQLQHAKQASHAPRPKKSELKARMPIQSRGTAGLDKGKGRATSTPQKPISISSSSEDEEDDLEEVPIPSTAGPSSPYPGTPHTPGTNLTHATGTPGTVTTAPSVDDDYGSYDEDDAHKKSHEEVITLEIGGETPEEREKRIALALRKKPMTSKDRAIRLEAHKLHVIALLASARIRNRWCNNLLLKARLLSLLPHPLVSAFNIPPSRFPDRAQRSRLFFDALQTLVTWWSQTFFDISNPNIGLRTRPWDDVQEIVDQLPILTRADMLGSSFGEKASDWTDSMDKLAEGSGGEMLRSANSLMKKVLQQEGSRDVSAQLFVALARACGLGVRLIVSIQAVPWRAEKVVPKKMSGGGKAKRGKTVASRQGNGAESESEEEEMEEVPIPDAEEEDGGPEEVVKKVKGKKSTIRQAGRRRHIDPADVYRLKKPAVQKVGTIPKPRPKAKEDLSHQPPVFWAEVFSRSDQRWVPVDPVLGTIRKKAHFEPVSDSAPIRMLYVVAFEEDGYARDVTLRYTKNFGAKTVKLRVPQKKDEPDWWQDILSFLQRPYRLRRDELEDAELETSQISESMPMHMNGFKDHPLYALERHLKREEVILPKKEIGRFRGEPVYRRQNVLACKTAETWMRQGRRVKDRQEPLKWVKQRAVTLQKRRAQELAVQETGESIQQGLYADYQTEVYLPPPIKNGQIPQNSFGNIDLYAPTMLPQGAVHLPYKGIAKIAKALEISYAEACTGFAFKKQRAIPVITGIVVAKDNETLVMEAYEESAAAAEIRERTKKEERALKRWVKLINGLRVRSRLQAQYGTGEGLQEQQRNPLADPNEPQPGRSAAAVIASAHKEAGDSWSKQVKERSPSEEPQLAVEENSVKVESEGKQGTLAENGRSDKHQLQDVHAANNDLTANGNYTDSERVSPEPEQVEGVQAHDYAAEPTSPTLAEDDDSDELEEVLPTRDTGGHSIGVPQPAKRGGRPGRKARKAPTPVSDEPTENFDRPKRATRAKRQKVQKAAVAPSTSTRSLRSRTSKTEEQMKEV